MNDSNYEIPHCVAFSIPHSLGHKYSPQDPVFKYPSLDSSLNVRDHVSQPYSTTGNTIVLYILLIKFLERSLEDKSVWTDKRNK